MNRRWLPDRLFPYCMCILIGLTGCEAVPREPVMVADSAGVRISISQDASLPLEIDPEPILHLGGSDVSGPAQFFNIRGIHVDRERNLWIADGGSNEIRIFRSDGTHWRTVGGHGQGPGEFQRIRLLGAFRADSIAFWDDANPRLTVYNAEGNLSRTTSLQTDGGLPPQALDVFPDGTLLVRVRREVLAASLTPGQVLSDTAHFARLDPITSLQWPLGSTLGARWVWTGRNQIPIPFTSNPAFDLDGDRLLVSSEPAFRIRTFSDDVLEEIYGVARSDRQVTREDANAYTELMSQAMPDTILRREYLSLLEHPERPRRLPAYSRIIVSDDGSSWAQVYSPNPLDASTWDVFGTGREWVGRVEAPAGFAIEYISQGRLYGVWRDELGVESVRIYGFRSIGSGTRR